VFHSSGTTEQKPSRHFHSAESLALYEASLWAWFEQHVLTDLRFTIYDLRLQKKSHVAEKSAIRNPQSAIFLTPPPEQVPHSSLVHMFEVIRRKMGGASVLASRTEFVGKISEDSAWTLNFEAVLGALENRQSAIGNRQLILGTAFSFVHLLDFLAEKNLKFQLPENSRVMETGGYKNRSRSLPKNELHALIEKFLGVPRENIICEYGMSELSSQAYANARGAGRWARGKDCASPPPKASSPEPFYFPPWARAQIISPETGREVADGETGLIRIFDLANVFSIAAIQTEDLGIRRGAHFELIGRAQLAEPRGCSLMTTL
ncbi:MAG TPA: hypothetical protein VFC85_03720, partial [Verrucomicrobiae bacterium]|nr:hypothetical protein [Verrucomicrobiae bacterium]